MKFNLLGSSLLLCFESVSALYPANIGQIQHFDGVNHQIIRRNSDQEAKSFDVTLECSGPQCKKVSETLDKLTGTLSSFIQVKNQIKIIATYKSLCELAKICNITDEAKFGTVYVRKHLSIKNKDGKNIDYPIALYKQLAEPSKNDDNMPKTPGDIYLNFNSDVKYWFEGDGNIEVGQPDFLIAAARNLVRGLGLRFTIGETGSSVFSSDRRSENNTKPITDDKIFTPGFQFSLGDSDQIILKSFRFYRHILDTLIVTTSDGKSINNLLDPYADFVFPNHTIPSNEIISYWKKTPINEASQKLEKLWNTPDSLAIKLPSGNLLAFETTTKVDGDNYSALLFSESKYLNTKDALLTAKVTKSEARLPSEKPEDWPTYPFGPVLIETLEYMGYTLKDSYKKSVSSSTSKKDGDKADSKSGNDSSNVKANIVLLSAIATLYLLS